MIAGIGLDIVEIKRIENLLHRQTTFAQRVLTANELEIFQSLSPKRQSEYLAGRFAAKEAFSKAYGTGIGTELSFHDIEIQYDENGKPMIVKPFKEGVHLSITHSREFAAAQVVIEKMGKVF
jgi:holo-[acyl-carrier protein] synthase